jgi:hypothetical protein
MNQALRAMGEECDDATAQALRAIPNLTSDEAPLRSQLAAIQFNPETYQNYQVWAEKEGDPQTKEKNNSTSLTLLLQFMCLCVAVVCWCADAMSDAASE